MTFMTLAEKSPILKKRTVKHYKFGQGQGIHVLNRKIRRENKKIKKSVYVKAMVGHDSLAFDTQFGC